MNDNLFHSLGSSFNTELNNDNSMSTSSLSYYFPPTSTPAQTAPPSFPNNALADIAQMKLVDLLVNRHVEDLFNKWTDANSKATRYIEEQHRLLQQVSALQNTVFALRVELATAQTKLQGANQVSVSDAMPTAAVTQPSGGTTRIQAGSRRITRPENLPHSVLWLIDNMRQYEELTTKSNKSRPKMELCICRADREVISNAEFTALQVLVRRIVSQTLIPLVTPKNPAAASSPQTRKWYRKWYTQNYQDVLAKLKEGEPLLALCSGSWKANQLVGHHLYWLAEQAKKESEEGGQKRPFEEIDDFEEECGDQFAEATSSKANRGPVPKKRKQTVATMGKGKDKENAVPLSPTPSRLSPISAASQSSSSLSPPLSIKTQLTTLGQAALPSRPLSCKDDLTQKSSEPVVASTLSQKFNCSETSIPPCSDLPPTGNTRCASAPQPSNQLDIAFIQIDKTLPFLRRKFSTDFPNMTTITNLFNAMEANPRFVDKSPSIAVVQFIEALESADPNSSDFSEDDTNAQWGHKQLSGVWKGILTSWDAIGRSDVTTCLLVALLKTCRVARYICSERRIQAGSYLADMYLDQIVDHLWELWKAAGGPILKGKGKENTTTATSVPSSTMIPAPSTPNTGSADPDSAAAASDMPTTPNDVDHQNEVEKALRKLTKDQLKDLLDTHSIKITSRKSQPTKPELLSDILNAPISSTDAIFAEVQSRLDKCPPRVRNKGLAGS